MRRFRAVVSKSLALVVGMGMAQLAIGAPGEVLNSPAPVIGGDAPKGAEINAGDAKVSPQTGAFQYSYGIAVPPGRAGMQPSLTLGYSSQAPRYGTVAAGWSLSFPSISRDFSNGFHGEERWTSSLAGGRVLVKSDGEPAPADVSGTFRAQSDSSFARYERLQDDENGGVRWRVRETNGVVHEFGSHGASQFTTWVPITRTRDAFGNEVQYHWEYVAGGPGSSAWHDLQISRITYTHNDNAGLDYHAEVDFTYDDVGACEEGVGGQLAYELGEKRMRGASKLVGIETRVRSDVGAALETVRKVELVYDQDAMACGQNHAPVRLLTQIKETDAAGTLIRPSVTFGYGEVVRPAMSTVAFAPRINVSDDDAIGAGRRFHGFQAWSSLDSQLMDVNADGRPDRLFEQSVDNRNCGIRWDKNVSTAGGNVAFAGTGVVTNIPGIPWKSVTPPTATDGDPQPLENSLDYGVMGPGESCSLSGQYSLYANKQPTENSCYDKNLGHYLVYRFLDLDGDGSQELVTALHYDPDYYDPLEKPRVTTQGDPNVSMQDLPDPPALVDPDAACRVIEPTCLDQAVVCADGHCGYDDDAVDHCMLGAPRQPCHLSELEMLTGGTGPVEWGQATNPMTRPPGPNGPCKRGRVPQTDGTGKRFLWTIYKANGDGTFDVAGGKPIYAPIALSSSAGDPVGQNGRQMSSGTQTIIDINGDGNLDLVQVDQSSFGVGSGDGIWNVWFGDGEGGFVGEFVGTEEIPFPWYTPRPARPTASLNGGGTVTGRKESRQPMGMFDINGDGRPDFVYANSNHQLVVHYNTGERFAKVPDALGAAGLRPWVATSSYPALLDSGSGEHEGTTQTELRFTDVDGDGRVDVYAADEAGGPVVWWNGGQGMLASSSVDPNTASLMAELTTVTSKGTDVDQVDAGNWVVGRTPMDIDGDGRTDSVAPGMGTNVVALDGTKAGLLKTIDNGRGLTTTVRYAPHVDDTVVTHGTSPRSVWVVESLTNEDAHAPLAPGQEEKTRYTYVDPVMTADDFGKFAFRGFKETRAQGPSGAITMSLFDYAKDWSGRGIETAVYASDGKLDADAPHSVSQTQWTRHTLFTNAAGETAAVFVSDRALSWTCSSTDTRQSCLDGPNVLRTDYVWEPVASGSVPAVLLFQKETMVRAHDSTDDAVGDYQDLAIPDLYYDADTYQLRTSLQARVDFSESTGAFSRVRTKTAHEYSPGGRFETKTYVWHNDDKVAITVRTFDDLTGNHKTTLKPQQNADGKTLVTSLDYGPHKIYVSKSTNELGHVVETETDFRTGKTKRTTGPNEFACGFLCLAAEETRFDLDIHGRVVATWKLDPTSNGGAELIKVEQVTYDDLSSPQTAKTESLISAPGSAEGWSTVERVFDGHGRLSTQTAHTSGPSHAVSTYSYDETSKLVAVTVPDPANNYASIVAYNYRFDSLGRATSIVRPNGSGVWLTHDGLVTTRQEGMADGQGQRTIGGATPGTVFEEKRLTNNVHGRLVKVEEARDTDVWVAWTYAHDSKGQLELVQGPEGVTTEVTHDWAGNRTSIKRANGTWRYTYDLNGNTQARTEPVPSGADASLYTTTYTYDDLDRARTRLPAWRDLSDEQISELAVGVVETTYDTSDHGVGRVASETRWTPIVSSSSGFPQPLLRTTYMYDTAGTVLSETRTFDLAPIGVNIADSRTVTRIHDATSRLRYMWFPTSAPETAGDVYSNPYLTSAPLAFAFGYDERGMPRSGALLQRGLGPFMQPTMRAVHARNVAGGIRETKFDIGDLYSSYGQVYAARATHVYDSLGRVKDYVVDAGVVGSLHQRAKQHADYSDTDDVISAVSEVHGTQPRTINYDYDARHQLVAVSDDRDFSAVYQYGPAGRLTDAHVAATNAPVAHPRTVTYRYPAAGDTSADPEAPLALERQDGTDRAVFEYDNAGNLVRRVLGGQSASDPETVYTFLYDGDQRQRKATVESGDTGALGGLTWFITPVGAPLKHQVDYYDGSGSRALQITKEGDTIKRVRLWFGPLEIWYQADGGAEKQWAHLSHGGPLARVPLDAPLPVTQVAELDPSMNLSVLAENYNGIELQFHNQLGHLLLTLNDWMYPTGGFQYGPFGEVLAEVGAPSKHLRRFNGKEFDETTGLSYYGFRHYDPLSMTWTQADPLFRFAPETAFDAPRLMNLYTFSLNAPTRYVDPDGRRPTGRDQDQAGSGGWTVGHRDRIPLAPGYRGPSGVKALARLNNPVSQWVLDETIVGHAMKDWADGKAIGRVFQAMVGSILTRGRGANVRVTLKPVGPGRKLVQLQPRPPKAKADAKQTGSYTNTHASRRTYSGKGDRARSQKSGRRVAKENDDPHIATDWTPASGKREAFKQESRRIDENGGVSSSSNYNKVESPGKQYRREDGEIAQ